ncbi:MAG: 23S rRNA (uracil(1939)-C(5))-methyltransferase RlmD [Elusimicrobiota bacterium]
MAPTKGHPPAGGASASPAGEMSAAPDNGQPPVGGLPTQARCRHFGDCGGCRMQDLPYEAQVAKKAEELSRLMAPLGLSGGVLVHPSPEPWYYRNKMEYSFQDVYPAPPPGEDALLLGLKRRNRWDKVMNLEECFLLSPEAPALLKGVHEWARRENLVPYNLHRQEGFLRHLLVREGKNTGERMVVCVTSPGPFPAESFVKAVTACYPASTVLRGIHTSKSDTASSEKLELLHGPGHIYEEFLGKRFRISPYSFAQTNSRGAEFLYGLLRSWLTELEPKNLLDLFCGGGGIGLSVADLCAQVMGVELVDSAVEDARHNAEINKVPNAQFMAAKVEEILPGLAAQGVEVDTVIVDPPRSGLHPSAVPALKELGAKHILYVSCNPKAMAEDLRRLADLYDLRKVEGVDLFPHTDHIEAVALLRTIY